MAAEWFTEPEGFIAETSWGRFQDTPIFRSLARDHNVKVAEEEEVHPWFKTEEGSAFRKALLIQAIADGGYNEHSE